MNSSEREVSVPGGSGIVLKGNLTIPDVVGGVVLFAHGSGSSRFSPRNRHVASSLQQAGLATLLIDLLTAEEEQAEQWTRHLRFNIELLAERLVGATRWLSRESAAQNLRIGYFGASTGAAAALVAAAREPAQISAVVSRGGRPDLAGEELPNVRAPTLLIVGGEDVPVIGMNREAQQRLRTETKLEIVAGATHLFEEPGALERVAELANQWFVRHLSAVEEPRSQENRQNP